MPEAETPVIRIVLADDHLMFVEAIRLILNQDPDMDVIAAVHDGDALCESIQRLQPDIALVDVTMDGPGARAIAAQIADAGAPTRLIALTMHLDHGLAELLMHRGFSGYVVKDAAVGDLANAIRQVHAGGEFLSEAILEIGRARQGQARLLTKRETDCLQRAAEGLSNKLIAKDLGLTERTVKFHFENTLRKLDAATRGEAVAKARRAHLL